MTTAQEIVDDAAALILVDEANTALEPNESAIMTRFLNDYLAELHSGGVDIGYRPVSSPSDVVTIPLGANQAIKYGLALRSNAIFGLPVPQEVSGLAPGLERGLRARYQILPKIRRPATLPRGSGNNYNSYTLNTFYPPTRPEGALRLGSPTTVTINAIDTAEVVTGPWLTDLLTNLNSTGAGEFQYVPYEPYLARVQVNLSLTSTNGDRYNFYITRNGAKVEQSDYAVTADRVQNIFFQWSDTVMRQDTIRLVVENQTGTNDLDISNGHFRLD